MITRSLSTASTLRSNASCSSSLDVGAGGQLRLVLPAPALPPADERLRVVRRGVEHRIGAPVELADPGDDVHARQPERLAERDHVRRDVSEIFEDQRQAAESIPDGVEERHPWATPPGSPGRVLLVERKLPELHEPTEVVDPQQVAQLELALEPLEPPAEAVARHAPASRRRASPSAGPPGWLRDGAAPATTERSKRSGCVATSQESPAT